MEILHIFHSGFHFFLLFHTACFSFCLFWALWNNILALFHILHLYRSLTYHIWKWIHWYISFKHSVENIFVFFSLFSFQFFFFLSEMFDFSSQEMLYSSAARTLCFQSTKKLTKQYGASNDHIAKDAAMSEMAEHAIHNSVIFFYLFLDTKIETILYF